MLSSKVHKKTAQAEACAKMIHLRSQLLRNASGSKSSAKITIKVTNCIVDQHIYFLLSKISIGIVAPNTEIVKEILPKEKTGEILPFL